MVGQSGRPVVVAVTPAVDVGVRMTGRLPSDVNRAEMSAPCQDMAPHSASDAESLD